jgi:hypothetical protein
LPFWEIAPGVAKAVRGSMTITSKPARLAATASVCAISVAPNAKSRTAGAWTSKNNRRPATWDQGAPPPPQPRFDEVLQRIVPGFVRADQSLLARVNIRDKHASTPGGAFIGEHFQTTRLGRADILHIDLEPPAAGQAGPPSCFIRDAKLEQARRVRLHHLHRRADHLGLDAAAGH